MDRELVIVDTAQFARTAALRIATVIERSVRERGACELALPGGPQIAHVYRALRELQLPWSEVEFYFTDEKGVPSVHPSTSWFPAADLLFASPRIGFDAAHRIEAERPDHSAVAEEYEAQLPAALDLAVLEVGLDGHVAGLFPGSHWLAERERRVVAIETEHKPRRRITLTPRALDEARELIVLAFGRDRAAVVRRALREPGDARELPARLALRGTWVLDRAAAALL